MPGSRLGHAVDKPPHSSPLGEPRSRSSRGAAMAGLLGTIVVPFLIALALYLAAVYVFYPLYQRHRRYAAYIPLALPSPLPEGAASGLFARMRGAVLAPLERAKWFQQFQRPRRGPEEFEAFVGDEELREGSFNGGREDRAAAEQGDDDGRRLSRDLEAGFRDDSDEEEDGQRERVVSGRRTQ